MSVFADLLRRLAGSPRPEPLPELDAQLSVGALLVRLAKADQHYALEEIVAIDKLLAHHFALNPVDAAKMRATCERLSAEAPATDRFLGMVQAHVSHDERVRIYDSLWAVGLADRALKPQERALLGEIAGALGIEPEEAEATAARHLA